ncbi:hypothetical protein [Streptomyces antimycoticus]|uniref:hypothetical protein n=1 Tax=Streptomyces antimycoticus TaxID=68175 RepID=UPI00386E06F2|nr:hypothetical protein OG751_05095 [Streptomyces antimycoticus]
MSLGRHVALEDGDVGRRVPWPAVGDIVGVCRVALAGGFVLVQQRRGAGTE